MNNRIIKFRVWDDMDKKWVKDFCVITDCGSVQIYNSYGIPTPPRRRVSEGAEYIVQQFTGLKDKNNEEIYEGDVLLYKGKVSNEQIVVEYGQYNCGCCDYIYGFTCGQSRLAEKEIIGNIFETPNLLNAK